MKHVNKTTEQGSDSLPYNDIRFQFYYFTVVEFYFNNIYRCTTVAYPGILFGGRGGSINSVEDRENGDLGVVAP